MPHKAQIAAILCLLVSGCGLFSTMERITPAQASYRHETLQDGKVVGLIEVKSVAAGVVGGNVSDYSDGKVSAGPEGAATGAVVFKMFKPLESLAPLYIVGGIAVVGGIALGYFVGWGFGAMVAGAGIALIMAVRFIEVYPWAIFIPIVGVLVVAGYGLYRMYRGARTKKALQAVVAAVEEAGSTAKAAIKKRVKENAGTDEAAVRAEIEAVK